MGKTYGEILKCKDVDEQEVVLENKGTFCSKSKGVVNHVLDMDRRTKLMRKELSFNCLMTQKYSQMHL